MLFKLRAHDLDMAAADLVFAAMHPGCPNRVKRYKALTAHVRYAS
jgi:hypothetical protein